jgi:hypothetical protein
MTKLADNAMNKLEAKVIKAARKLCKKSYLEAEVPSPVYKNREDKMVSEVLDLIIRHCEKNYEYWLAVWLTGKVGVQAINKYAEEAATTLHIVSESERLLRLTKYAEKFQIGSTAYVDMFNLVSDDSFVELFNDYQDSMLERTMEIVSMIAKNVYIPSPYLITSVISLMNKNLGEMYVNGFLTVEEFFVERYYEITYDSQDADYFAERYINALNPQQQLCRDDEAREKVQRLLDRITTAIMKKKTEYLTRKILFDVDTFLHADLWKSEEYDYQSKKRDKELGIVKISEI